MSISRALYLEQVKLQAVSATYLLRNACNEVPEKDAMKIFMGRTE